MSLTSGNIPSSGFVIMSSLLFCLQLSFVIVHNYRRVLTAAASIDRPRLSRPTIKPCVCSHPFSVSQGPRVPDSRLWSYRWHACCTLFHLVSCRSSQDHDDWCQAPHPVSPRMLWLLDWSSCRSSYARPSCTCVTLMSWRTARPRMST
ncbi:hypothetical protein CC79DRAFT_686941 [Sarocladium strictum]